MGANIKRNLYNVQKISSDERQIYIIENLKAMYTDTLQGDQFHGGASGMVFVDLYDDSSYEKRVLGLY